MVVTARLISPQSLSLSLSPTHTHQGEAIPAFLTICIMPLTYSIAYGIIAGISSYIIIQVLGYQPCKGKKSEPTVDLEQIFVDDKKNKA